MIGYSVSLRNMLHCRYKWDELTSTWTKTIICLHKRFIHNQNVNNFQQMTCL